jgi:hypothetical protein
MLSFMREQEPQSTSRRPAPDADPAGLPSADPAGPQEYLTVAANSKSVRRSTTLVAVLVAVGLLCLMLMIRRSQPQAASAAPVGDQTKIEAAITRLTGVRSEMAGRMGEIVKKFYEFSDVVQVRVNELVKNPFEVEGFMKDLKTALPAENAQAQAELIRRQKLEQQAKTLKLLSIMRSDQGDCCMINDRILRQGDALAGFKIVRIAASSVELVWAPSGAPEAQVSPAEEMKVVLKLSE